MFRNLKSLWTRFWNDDCGSILSTEYMLLGSVVTLGSIGGLRAMRDASVAEMKSMGNDIRAVRQYYASQVPNLNSRYSRSSQQGQYSGSSYNYVP